MSPASSEPILVRKYGGSSLASVERIRAVARDLQSARERGYRLVVVVSAMGKTTDELSALAAEAHPNPPRREIDMLLSVGERITMSLLSMALADLGCPAISFTGSQCGIITDTSHSDARILEVRGDRVREALARGHVVVVAGFQGVSREKEITTLGRGGSDTTAVALAAALGAVRCEILKDVDGVLAADPRLVTDAARHDRLSWDEMRAIAESGSGVVHIRAVEYAAEHGVPLVVRSSFHEGPGTAIGTVPVDDAAVAGATAPPEPCGGGACTDRDNRYRPLAMNVDENVTRIRVVAADDAAGSRARDLLLEHLDPVLTVAEWLDSGGGFRWEGLTRQADLGALQAALEECPAACEWQEQLACVSLAGGRPDCWLEVQRHVTGVLAELNVSGWRLRADGSALRIVLPAPLRPDLVSALHRALLAG